MLHKSRSRYGDGGDERGRWRRRSGPAQTPSGRAHEPCSPQAVEAEVTSFLESHADKLTADGDRRLVRHGHLPEREILSGFAKAAADEANRRKLRITGPKLAGRHALTKGG